jgi:hypothetical protein
MEESFDKDFSSIAVFWMSFVFPFLVKSKEPSIYVVTCY